MTPGERRKWTDILLVAIAIGMVVTVFATEGGVTTAEKEAREGNLLLAWRDDEISRIEYDAGDTHVVLARGAESEDEVSWFLKKPVEEEADPTGVDEYLASLEFADWARTIKPEEVDRARFGLDQPKATIAIAMGAIRYQLKLGGEAVDPPGARYAEVAGKGAPGAKVGIISKSLAAELELKLDMLRERQLMPYLSSTAKRIELSGTGGKRVFVRGAWGGWRLSGGPRVDRVAFDRVLLSFARATAERFLSMEAGSKALGDGERVKVLLLPKKEDKQRGIIEVGGRCPVDENAVVAVRREPNPIAACVPRTVMDGLTTDAEDLRDAHVFSLRRDEVEQLTITRGERTLELLRKGTGFHMRKPREAEVDSEAGEARLKQLLATAGEIAAPADAPEKFDAGTAKLRSAGDSEEAVREEVVELAAGPDDSLWARRKDDGVVLRIPREAARALTVDASLVRSRTLISRAPNELASLEVSFDGVTQRIERSDAGVIRLVKPEGFDADGAVVADAFDAVAQLTADRWVADEDDGSFGLAKPLARATVVFRDRKDVETTRTITIGGPTRAGHFASLDGDEGVFVMPRRGVEALRTLAIDRSGFLLDGGRTRTITLKLGGETFELVRQGERYTASGGDDSLTPSQVARVVDALGVLRAEAALHTGAAKPAEGLGKPLLEVTYELEATAERPEKSVSWKIGAGDAWRGISVHYARIAGKNATYVVARSKVQQIVDVLSGG